MSERARPSRPWPLGLLAACLGNNGAALAAPPPEASAPVDPAPLVAASADAPTGTVAGEPAPPPTATIAVAPAAPPRATVVARPPSPLPPSSPVEQERVFYGWINMLVGEACIGVAFGAAVAGVKEAGLLGIGYLAAGPVIHALHGEDTHAWVSLGLNIGLPVAGMLNGLALDEAIDGSVGTRFAVGALTGFIAAPLLDGIALGWTDEPVAADAEDAATIVVLPRVDLAGGGYRGVDVAIGF